MTRTSAALLGLPGPLPEPDPRLTQRLRELVRGEHPLPGDVDAAEAAGEEIAAALVGLVPDALDRQRREGIAPDVTRETLADVGRKHLLYGAETVLPWLLGVLRGDVVSAGRLQVERRPGPHGHALHVPETGPLTPDAVDAALHRARALTGSGDFSCTSWLLDPVLSEELPGSNIARFAARFRVVDAPGDAEDGSRSAAKFVFRRPLADVRDPARVVPVTRLEALVASRLRAGLPWREPLGVLALAP